VSYTTTYTLDCNPYQILNLDADAYGHYIALLSNAEVWTPTWRLALPNTFEHPLIRELDEERFLIVEARRSARPNGHIFATSGQKLASFEAGDGIEDVLIQASRIVIAYFDEGVVGGKLPSRDGIAVFDFTGQQLFGFNASYPIAILDCYCMCRQGRDSIVAYTYPDFPLWTIRLTDFRVSKQATPSDFEGAAVMTTYQEGLLFYSSYAEQTSFFWWDRKEWVQRFPSTAQVLRGIGNGYFLTYATTSFTILAAGELIEQTHVQD
jgi:hypothetical protein